jgi:3-oxoadipate enol-lactonase
MRPKNSGAGAARATGLPELDARWADVKAGRLRYFVGGPVAADPLVLVHGLGGSASNWRALAPLLAPRYRLLVPELPGHGGSSPLPAVPNLDAFAERIGLLAQREGLTPAVFVGHSLGGLVSLRLAIRRPKLVRGVVLAGSAGISSTAGRAKKALAVTTVVKPGRRLAPYRRSIARRPRLRSAVLRWGVADAHALGPDVAESFLASPAAYTDLLSAATALVADDVRRDLEDVRCPCLVVWGTRDLQTTFSDGLGFARRLGAPFRAIADCGHLVIGERAEACADAIGEFVALLGSR